MNNKTKAICLMLVSAMTFAMMQIMIALTASTIPLFQQLFFRNLIASLVAYSAIYRQKLKPLGEKSNRGRLTWRAVFGYLGMITTFYASGHGVQGDVSTITKMSPFVVMVLAVIFLKEKVTKYQIVAIVVAFFGVYFVANPQFNSDVLPTIAAALACIFSGAAYTMVSALKGRERPEVIIFYFSAFSTVVTLPLMMPGFVMPTPLEWLGLLGIGLFAALGQITLTYSYAYAKASEVSIYNYSGIVFSMLFGWMFLGESLKSTSLLGGLLVIVAGLIVYFGGRKQTNIQ
ncbi:MAG: DMT family transporter [Eubacteriales bacterium]